ncbi:putative proton-dependent oligopeptide transporter family, major facilitator superfamily [Rosa chinensis]|uniref:Putative proton-dependent oligopeptide transporter family, major facilitator superfamily n=1 Tax=Rosa chinensis TaxID=74649 RepID=A0A2P6PEQ0_ROSCH|nr:protein NRT1/ PTR FAMILY 5.10 [Rosa chinensis]XP_040366666.1 protein NRT1/ PTR FAMILY 5.10 [Rosa chinensis]XP_040366667.1 protein NRT1/ PTR FAMILY 5.10 [Rosa chinensis]XP_040366668.1 protein NRT1/ PTR FAMILY 5.10 [Rosa chinensis]XP_040366669.1 protein NRT1/ PTR FAMILY 5.10 [Rosa chinensis]PRQ20410.1 putative proton-dependent oligopeptide transporter family, major facilitator superfamily [Rosa chinensis]
MAISQRDDPLDHKTPLLQNDVEAAVLDFRDSSFQKSSGGWRSAAFIIGVGCAERFAFYGVSSNLVTFLSGPLGESTATAAENVNTWSGTASLLPLLGAVVADSFLGRYRTIVISSLLYILGLGLLSFSAKLPSLTGSDCGNSSQLTSCYSQVQVIFFYFSLYLVAVGQGGNKPCIQAFGADQFDGQDPVESKAKSSFFNWWYFGICSGSLCTRLISSYIQDNFSWVLGFGIPCIVMALGLFVFLSGTRTYRYSVEGDGKSPYARIAKVFATAFKNWRTTPSEPLANLPHQSSEKYKFLNKALLPDSDLKDYNKVCTVSEVEEAKVVLSLFPIWSTCLVYAIVLAQMSTFFTKQGATLDREIVAGFEIPAASLQSFTSLIIILFIPIYERVFVPMASAFTGKPSGITTLQRIGVGIFLAALSMIAAAVVEMKRLETAQEYALVDLPHVTIPMGVWWLIPQYLLIGVSDVFSMVGLQEFFYDQVPNELRSVGVALYLSIFGVGNFLSSFLISAIEEATSGVGRVSWFSNNLNRAHLDYFYWLLAGLSVVELGVFTYFAKSYRYK